VPELGDTGHDDEAQTETQDAHGRLGDHQRLSSVETVGDSTAITIVAGPEVAPYIARKGSVCVDGVSLTVNEIEPLADGVRFGINLIPHTAQHTTLGGLQAGREVNLEIDLIARYLERMLASRG
jgi:riboflavin synthase